MLKLKNFQNTNKTVNIQYNSTQYIMTKAKTMTDTKGNNPVNNKSNIEDYMIYVSIDDINQKNNDVYIDPLVEIQRRIQEKNKLKNRTII